MNETNSKVITVEDFNVICRVCLEHGEDMVDIFKSGINNHLVEVTSLKMEIDDRLPKALCQKCNNQINELYVFLQQAKSSDSYLRSLLSGSIKTPVDSDYKSVGNLIKRKKSSKIKRKSKVKKKLKSNLESDKMYLIYVPDTEDNETKTNGEIQVKELTSDKESVELSSYCKTLLGSHNFSDHTYPKEENNSDEESSQIEIFKSNCFGLKEEKTFTVNLDVYNCNDCNSSYEELDDLTAHFSTHEVEPTFTKNNFICPVCNLSVDEKVIFTNHLKIHKENGFSFVKVNSSQEIIPIKENEKDLFFEPLSKQTKDCRVFCVNLNSLICSTCHEIIQSTDYISDHIKSCFYRNKSDSKFQITYTCPICCEIFTDEEAKYIKHLGFHNEENCYFIKVDHSGEPVQVADYEEAFVPFEEAVNIFNKKTKIFEIVDVNSCHKCNYSFESFNDICEHSSSVHFENISNEITFSCPVCLKEFNSGAIDENQAEFFQHLKDHGSKEVRFVLVKRNGLMSDFNQRYSDIFTQSQFLWSLINSSNFLFQSITPELVILDQKNCSKYICDLCKEGFRTKQEIIEHLNSHQDVHYICEKCGKKCLGKENYKKHFLKHSKILTSVCKRPICVICNKKFANRATLTGHMKHHLKEEIGSEFHNSLLGIICEKCGRSFSNNASLTKHKKMHSKEKENTVLKCEICDREFFRQSSFDRHKSAHLNPKYFECSICKLPLSSAAALQKHSEIHKNGSKTFDCKACQLSFLTKDSLTAHQTHTGHYLDREPFECNVCHEKFFIGKKFSEHIKIHPKYKMGECTLCGKRLSTIQSLMLHMGRHFESNSILCPHCGKQFFEERNYHRHLLTHRGIKPFLCDTEGCKKSFYTLFELNRHKKYHNNTRDFRCSYCSKSFHEANHLTVHIRTHTGERPYTCPHCNKGFVTRTHCKHHIKLMHQGVGYDLIRSNISKKVTVFEAVEA